MTNKGNTFEEFEKTATPEENPTTPGELSIGSLSDVAVGDQTKYVRPDLDKQTDVVAKFQIFEANINEEPQKSQSGSTEYWKISIVLTYESKNDDGVNNREYLSGARQFKQNDGTASSISFWYEGAESQVAQLWEKVAKKLGKEPEKLSPREFAAFLNSKPQVEIESQSFKNFGAVPGQPAKVSKNMVGKFL